MAAPSTPAPPLSGHTPTFPQEESLEKKKSVLRFRTFKVRKMNGEQKVERGVMMGGGYIRTVSECKRGAFL